MPAADLVAVPAQHGLGAHEQPDPVQHVAGQSVQQRGEQRPVGRRELRPLTMQLPFQDGKLMSEGQDLGVFGPVAHRQQPQHRQGVGDTEVRQSKQHREILAQRSSAIGPDRKGSTATRSCHPADSTAPRADEVSGTRKVAADP